MRTHPRKRVLGFVCAPRLELRLQCELQQEPEDL